jgi:hypothetical protein
MHIGELAKSAGASRKAIYLYEELGLIQAPLRKGSYRVYAPETVDQVKTIKCAQSLGFRLKELVWRNFRHIREGCAGCWSRSSIAQPSQVEI